MANRRFAIEHFVAYDKFKYASGAGATSSNTSPCPGRGRVSIANAGEGTTAGLSRLPEQRERLTQWEA